MVALDNSLIQEYSFHASKAVQKDPHVARFDAGAKKLHYIGAHHTDVACDGNGDIISYDTNPTLPLIEHEIASFKPDFIVIEAPDFLGVREHYQSSRHVKQPGVTMSDISEVAKTASMAQKLNIPYQGGEPDEEMLQAEMYKRGYSTQDMMGLYGFRQITQYNGNGEAQLDDAALGKLLNDYFSNHHSFKHIPQEQRLNYQSFKQWFAQKNDNPNLSIYNIARNDTAPIRDATATYFQKAMADIGDIREENINKVIENAFKKHDKVMVVYGSGHLVKSLPVYEQALGKPQIVSVNQLQAANEITEPQTEAQTDNSQVEPAAAESAQATKANTESPIIVPAEPKKWDFGERVYDFFKDITRPSMSDFCLIAGAAALLVGAATGFTLALFLTTGLMIGTGVFLKFEEKEERENKEEWRKAEYLKEIDVVGIPTPAIQAQVEVETAKEAEMNYRSDFANRYVAEKGSSHTLANTR